MIVSLTRNLSNLAELMGQGYTEDDAADFAAYLLDIGITDTDDLSNDEWTNHLWDWESE